MTSPILIAVDPRRDDPAALAPGLRLARLAAAPMLLASTADECLGVAAQRLLDAPSPIPAIQLRRLPDGSSPAHGLQALAREVAPLLIVLGSSSRGQLGRVLPGAVTDRLLHGAPCAVAVAPQVPSLESADTPLRRIGVAWVDTPDGRAALTAAAALAHASAAYLRLLVVMRPRDLYLSAAALPPFDDEVARRQDAEAELRRGLEGAGEASVSGQVLDGEPATALAAVSPDLDLLVCGSRDHGPVRSAMLGGTSHALVRRAACPVVVVPRAAEEALVGAFASGNPQASRPKSPMTAREPAPTVTAP